jgi:chromosome segregation ATPase
MWTRKGTRAQVADSCSIGSEDKVLQFPAGPRCSKTNDAESALGLVQQAAEAIKGLEARAAEVEARAQSLAQDAIERLRNAESRIQALEAERSSFEARMDAATHKILEADKALTRAESRIEGAEEQLFKAQLRAHGAETRASEAEKALLRIEDAIRTQLLGQTRGASKRPVRQCELEGFRPAGAPGSMSNRA